MENDLLYLSLRKIIMEQIFKGIFLDGEAIPSERVLAQIYHMSRATVRKALEILEQDGIIQRTLGKGTIVRLNKRSTSGNLDMIALVAPAQKRFFANFINDFQKTADSQHSLVVFIQQSEGESIEYTLFKLLLNNIHNVVIWLDYETIKKEYIERLRGLGMNIVFFDITVSSPYADCICLDNQDAVSTLYQYAQDRRGDRIIYISRENSAPSSYYEREQAYLAVSPLGLIWNFPSDYKNDPLKHADKFIFEYFMPKYKPDSVICSDGELGIILKNALLKHDIHDVLLVSIDDFEESEELKITVLRQLFHLYAQTIYNSLREQNYNSANWTASMYRVKGELVIRDKADPLTINQPTQKDTRKGPYDL